LSIPKFFHTSSLDRERFLVIDKGEFSHHKGVDMKLVRRILVAMCLTLLTLSSIAHAGSTPPPDKSSPELQRIKSLAGRWTTVTSMFTGKPQRVYTEYQVTAGGSAVLERIFPGTPMEMISVYYDDDHGKLAMTHYCIMRNRPTLKLQSTTPDSVSMKVASIGGLKSKNDARMGNMTYVFKDKNHFSATCGGKGADKDKESPHTFEYTRVK
jgi:hypothetical protein